MEGADMAEIWQTIEQAAVTLGLSVRTVNRHITGGKLQSRLFEGRREVLVSSMADVVAERSANRSASHAAPASYTPSDESRESKPATVADKAADEDPTAWRTVSAASAGVNGGAVDGHAATAEPNFREAGRQRVTAEVAGDKPLDLQTMLALTDSIDDKATLAVAAYQTLARSAETQVQSLRRVAFGAWAVVGGMAAGLIIAVGWGATRLATAESAANHLQERVAQQTQDASRTALERDAAQQKLDALNLELREEVRKGAALSAKGAALSAEESKVARQAAEQSAFIIRQAATQPAVASPPPVVPATQPAATAIPATVFTSVTPVGPGSRPAAKLPGSPNQHPTYIPNSNATFDPK
jgi:hypothetical protein